MDEAAHHREDVLDAVRQLLADDLPLLEREFLLVDVGAGAEPTGNPPVLVTDRLRAAEHPAIGAVEMPQPVFDLVGRAGFQAVAPHLPCAILIVGMEHVVPAFAVSGAGGRAGELVPARVVVIVIAVRLRRPHHLRHGIREGAKSDLAILQRGARFGDGFAFLALFACDAPRIKARHDAGGEDFEPAGLEGGEAIARRHVDDADRTQRYAFSRHQRRAGIEADERLPGDQRVIRKAHVARRVRHFHHMVAVHGIGAEGLGPRRAGKLGAGAREEGLELLLDQTDHRDGGGAQFRGERCQIVQHAFFACAGKIVERHHTGAIDLVEQWWMGVRNGSWQRWSVSGANA